MELEILLAALGLSDSGITDWDGLTAHLNKEPEVAPEVALYNALVAVDKDLTPETLTVLQSNQLQDGAVLLEEGQTIVTDDQTAILTKVEELGGLEEVETQVGLGATYLTQIRNNAVADYKTVAGDTASEEIVKTVENADLPTAKAFEASFHTQLEKAVPLTCQECGSENVNRASHKKDGDGPDDTSSNSYTESRDKAAKKNRRKASDIHTK